VSWEWSRRAALVIAAAVLLGHHLLRHGFIRRIHIFLMAPLLLTIAIFLLVYRVTVITGSPIDAVATKGLIAYFLDKLWLEASAFSAQLYIVKNFGLDSFLGGESLLAPFMFWIPRAVFPWKPNAFFLGDIIGTEYTIGVGLYGEIAANFTVMGVVPCLWFLGYVFKRLDLYFQDSGRRALHVMLYVMFVFDVIFFVRGTFNAMVVPLLTHVAIPAIMYWSFNVLRLMMIRVSAADGRTTEGQRTWA
jgi:oligosaccharide repeat unit polymerase